MDIKLQSIPAEQLIHEDSSYYQPIEDYQYIIGEFTNTSKEIIGIVTVGDGTGLMMPSSKMFVSNQNEPINGLADYWKKNLPTVYIESGESLSLTIKILHNKYRLDSMELLFYTYIDSIQHENIVVREVNYD